MSCAEAKTYAEGILTVNIGVGSNHQGTVRVVVEQSPRQAGSANSIAGWICAKGRHG